MKQRMKQRVAGILVATLATGFATAAAAQSTQAPRQGGVYQYGDDRTNGGPTGQSSNGSQNRRQSDYPQPGTAADTSAPPTSPGGIQDSTAQPMQQSTQPGR